MYRFSYEKKKKKKHPKTTNIFIQTEKKKRKENLFLIYPDISIDRRDTRTQSFHSCWAGAAVMNGSPLAYIFFSEARTVSKNRVCRSSGIWDRSVRGGARTERTND